MKLIVAYIRPGNLGAVKASLFENNIKNLSVTNALGCGQQGGFVESYRGAQEEMMLLEKVRLEVVVNDNFADKTIKAIVKGAKKGKIGDGKIFVSSIEECIRIRTGEKGQKAIG